MLSFFTIYVVLGVFTSGPCRINTFRFLNDFCCVWALAVRKGF